MRLATALVLVIGCTTTGSETPGTPEPEPEPEALPTRACGEAPAGNVGCDPFRPLCFGWANNPFARAGDCVSAPAAGTLDIAVDGSPQAATRVAAVVHGAYLELSAEVDGQTLVLVTTAEIGTHSCDALHGFALARDVRYGNFGEVADCTITLTAVGEVGADVAGTFAGTLVELGPQARTIAITDGAFRVERVAY